MTDKGGKLEIVFVIYLSASMVEVFPLSVVLLVHNYIVRSFPDMGDAYPSNVRLKC